MTDPSRSAVCLLVDRSGSMAKIGVEAEGSLNAFLDEQRAEGPSRTVRLVEFDDRYDLVFPSTPAPDVPRYTLKPRGMTALLDAMGRAMTEFGEELAAIPEAERPGTVVFVALTDGQENNSTEWDYDRVSALLRKQVEVYKWNVAYLGANQDVIAEAAKLGVDAGSVMAFAASADGYDGATRAVSSYVTSSTRGRGSFTP